MAAIAGKVSWFGGANDPEDSGHTANGETTKTPGIAVYNHGTLGGYWRVKAPNGKTAVLKQTDIGPAPWTGRKIDVTYSALNKFGFNEHDFPTDSHFEAEYLGRKPPKEVAQTTASLPGLSRPTEKNSTPTDSLDKTAFRRAETDAEIGKLFAQNKEGDSSLFSGGVLTTKTPNPSEYQLPTSGVEPDVQTHTAGGALPNAHPQDEPKLAGIVAEANHIAEAKVPYLWGGGHGAKVLPNAKVTPLDCSGAVSAALGLNPKVSGEFEQWGAPGKGGHLTIYANSHHVLMEVNGKFWGTSASNPGGGAGWIKPGVITPEYLKQFTARHPSGEQMIASHPSGPVVQTPRGPVFVPHR